MSSKVARPQEKVVKENKQTKRKKLVAGIIAGLLAFAMIASTIIGALVGML